MRLSRLRAPAGRVSLVLIGIVASLSVPIGAAAAAHEGAVLECTFQGAGTVNETDIVRAFETRVSEYVALHRLLEGPLPPLQVSKDMSTVRAAADALAKRLEAARPNARQGDLITPDIARVFRKRIAACLPPEEMQAVLAEGEPGELDVAPTLVVNTVWPEGVPFHFVPPELIATLPPLPPELQYRIIGGTLVLWDHHANVIVDFLPAAFTN